ncbi:uncharacterized protein LOC123876705 [Maniola jurtina]|uniref:uncharacterized protein LOC123876705 n=1 Tax=Maniola jurtina TaxID=191418 RepID=UPI001E689316|nr:uncharacterized protein LOC123876705 [Maniola jurtina]
MKARHTFFALSILYSLSSVCATETKSSDTPDEIGATEACKSELKSLFVTAGLSDTIILSAPIIKNRNTFYYLSNPNGDSMKLNINTTRFTTDYKETSQMKNNYAENHNLTKYEGKLKSIIATNKKPRILGLNHENYENNCLVSYNDFEKQPNDFTIGPLSEDDHGNWVLSSYYKGNDGDYDWIELFQVITISIVESFPTHAPNTKLVPGQTFEPSFLYPINNLESCDIRPPRTTFDRFYDRDRFNLDSCGFRIPNVTKDDEGLWKIFGVGKLVYKGEIYLQIDDEYFV